MAILPVSQPLLKKLDQALLASLALAALVCLGAWLAAQHGRRGLIEIDRATPLRYEFLVDVNQADWPELAQLPGIGEVLARRIVAARAEGRFRTTDDLLHVEGIGPRKLAQMQRHLLPLPEDEMLAEGGRTKRAGGS